MDDDNDVAPKGVITVGDDLYGASVAELKARIEALRVEIARTEAELTKKSSELDAANALFGGKS